jgi:glutamate 5-kinase
MTTGTSQSAQKQVVLIKLSTSFFTQRTPDFLKQLAEVVAAHSDQYDFVMVSSGAIGLGMRDMGIAKYPENSSMRQALAAVGQPILMRRWRKGFENKSHPRKVAQLLVTHGDMDSPQKASDIQKFLRCVMAAGIIAVANENDSVSYREITFGDNDQLAARLAILLGAKKFIMLTHKVEGILDPDKKLIRHLEGVPDALYRSLNGEGEATSRGGMRSKVIAATTYLASMEDACCYIVGGRAIPTKLNDLLAGQAIRATQILPGEIGPALQRDMMTRALRFNPVS